MPYVLAILYMGLPIPTTIVGKWLKSLIFCEDYKCITANRQAIINVGVDKIIMSYDNYSFCAKILETLHHS